MQPRVRDTMNGFDNVVRREDLEGLAIPRQGLLEHTTCGFRRQAVHGILAHIREPAELAETPVVHEEGAVAAERQVESVVYRGGDQGLRVVPAVAGLLLLTPAVLPESHE